MSSVDSALAEWPEVRDDLDEPCGGEPSPETIRAAREFAASLPRNIREPAVYVWSQGGHDDCKVWFDWSCVNGKTLVVAVYHKNAKARLCFASIHDDIRDHAELEADTGAMPERIAAHLRAIT